MRTRWRHLDVSPGGENERIHLVFVNHFHHLYLATSFTLCAVFVGGKKCVLSAVCTKILRSHSTVCRRSKNPACLKQCSRPLVQFMSDIRQASLYGCCHLLHVLSLQLSDPLCWDTLECGVFFKCVCVKCEKCLLFSSSFHHHTYT